MTQEQIDAVAKSHFNMLVEFIKGKDPKFMEQLDSYLYARQSEPAYVSSSPVVGQLRALVSLVDDKFDNKLLYNYYVSSNMGTTAYIAPEFRLASTFLFALEEPEYKMGA